MRALIITRSQFQDQEVHYPYHRLREENKEPIVMAEKRGPIKGILGTEIEATDTYATLDHMQSLAKLDEECDLLVLPGGVKAMEKLRQDQPVLTFIKGWMKQGKKLACMCSGIQLLISADVIRGRVVTCYPAFGIDAKNAGAIYYDAPFVVDGNLITSPHHRYLAEWMKATIQSANPKPEGYEPHVGRLVA